MINKLLLFLIRGYQNYISPCFPSSCRFHPSCSQYALEAVGKYGVMKGGYLSMKRFLRCHPFHKQKTMICDPVP